MSSNFQRQEASSNRYVNRRAEEAVIDANHGFHPEKQRTPKKFYGSLQRGEIGIDETIKDPEFDLYIEQGFQPPEGIDSFTYAGSINHVLENSSRLNGVSLDSDQGYFEVNTYNGDDWRVFIPMIDEESGDVLMQAESPWTGEQASLGYDRRLDAPEGFSNDVLNICYDLAREVFPESGIPVQGRSAETLASEVSAFEKIDAFSRLERAGEANFGNHESVGKSGHQGRGIPLAMDNLADKLRDARVIDYTTEIFGNDQSKIEIDSGGYKQLTSEDENPEEVVRERIPESWK